ncbi:Uncharacterised protein [Acinetobacter baumannii]|nr:Uncharacterised protein [Acinetobacter baumannii]
MQMLVYRLLLHLCRIDNVYQDKTVLRLDQLEPLFEGHESPLWRSAQLGSQPIVAGRYNLHEPAYLAVLQLVC